MDTNESSSKGGWRGIEQEVALAHRYRWRLLYCLFAYANPMRLPDIADQLTVWEQADSETDFLEQRLLIYDALYHDHLPALEDADIVRYTQQNDAVELDSAAEQLEPIIRDKLQSEISHLLAAERSIEDTTI